MGIKHIVMPDLGESVTEATVVEWLVKEGDTVRKYEPLLEAQSDKVVSEIPSEFDGKIKKLLVAEGETVAIGTKLLAIEAGEAEKTAAELPATPEAALQEAFEPEAETIQETEPAPIQSPPQEKQPNASASADEMKARYSPAVLRIAQEKDIDLSQVTGTGRHGRITRKDVENFEPAISRQEAPVSRRAGADAMEMTGRQQVVQADGIRKAIAANVTRSVREIPHAWMMVEADVTQLVRLREQVKENFQREEGLALSFFPFFVKAVAQALKKHPLLNASWDEGAITYNKDINLSIAVATEEHLFVPVIHQADQYSIKGLTKEIKRLAEAARAGKLGADDMQGGTFTVNNTGSFGSVQSMGIINYPQVAILQVETISKKIIPTADGFKIADRVNLCLSIDHRLLDGLQAGRFLQEVKANLALFTEEAQLY